MNAESGRQSVYWRKHTVMSGFFMGSNTTVVNANDIHRHLIGYKEFDPYFTAVEEAIKNNLPTCKTWRQLAEANQQDQIDFTNQYLHLHAQRLCRFSRA